MAGYVKHKDTGEVYPINEHLMKRGDMIPCNFDGSEVETVEAEVKPKAPRKARAKKEDQTAASVDDLDDFDLGDAE